MCWTSCIVPPPVSCTVVAKAAGTAPLTAHVRGHAPYIPRPSTGGLRHRSHHGCVAIRCTGSRTLASRPTDGGAIIAGDLAVAGERARTTEDHEHDVGRVGGETAHVAGHRAEDAVLGIRWHGQLAHRPLPDVQHVGAHPVPDDVTAGGGGELRRPRIAD